MYGWREENSIESINMLMYYIDNSEWKKEYIKKRK
jgi:hypothetical protein